MKKKTIPLKMKFNPGLQKYEPDLKMKNPYKSQSNKALTKEFTKYITILFLILILALIFNAFR